ncbi:signal peptidase I [Vagococcus fluvialis]|uniref:Signal peptidase I n=1 Tax=Vagococcus fluvialis TaxID=2738 RepID=A0A7X6D9R8_9ENTE|nr:signal peptidase I [Vagococcus fluvialis]NKC68422.1 signal peptidase I [Vagococcus fluvialis]
MKKPNKTRHKRRKKKQVIKRKNQNISKYIPKLKDASLFFSIFIIILIAFIGILSCFFSIRQVDGYGMLPTLRDKDILIIQKKAKLKRFDLVFLNNGRDGEFRRIIGLPGERIEVKNDVLLVDGIPFDEKYLVNKINNYQQMGQQFTEDFDLSKVNEKSTIPIGYYLVLGDNRPYTTDSRDYGLVSLDGIIGRAILCLYPVERAVYY